jgi:hypothetical protein
MYLHWIEQMQKIESMNASWLNLIDTFWFVWRLVISIIVFTLVITTSEVCSKDVHASWFLIALHIMKVAIGVVNIVVFLCLKFANCCSCFQLCVWWNISMNVKFQLNVGMLLLMQGGVVTFYKIHILASDGGQVWCIFAMIVLVGNDIQKEQ